MKSFFILSSLKGWAETLLGSPYLYIATGGFFFIILICTLWHLLRKSSRCAHSKSHRAISTENHSPAITGVEDYARRVAETIAKLEGKSKSILLAGAGLESLPVTVSVKASIELAKTGKKCLLVDLDTRRNAAAKVFDIHSDYVNTPRPKPIATVIEHLSLWPAEFFVRFARMNLQHIIQSSVGDYELILINAPYLDGHPDRKLIASSAEYGIIFCQKPQQLERLTQLLNSNNCKVLSTRPTNQ